MKINLEEAKKLLKQTDGKFFSVTFVKKDGTLRDMTARLGVKKHLRGGELPYDAESKNLLPVFDVVKEDYRMIGLDTIVKMKVDGVEYVIDPDVSTGVAQ